MASTSDRKQKIKTDICVIGAGSGGLSVAAGAINMGGRVVLIEKGLMGGDCLNTGCVPSKALLAAAKRAHDIRDSQKFGITPQNPQINWLDVRAHVERAIATIAPHDSVERFEGMGVKVIQACAKFISPDQVEAGTYQIKAKYFVVATGSKPKMPDIEDLETIDYLTNETIFKLDQLPQHLV
ncbi:MAG: FAD-dependent oxidoreductase, partial [Pseudomonadota bacterium]